MSGTAYQELIERCRRGDEAAFRQLVDDYKGMVFGLIGRAVADRARVEELAQDVFLRVHRGLPYFRGDSRLSTWLYRIGCPQSRGTSPPIPSVTLDSIQARWIARLRRLNYAIGWSVPW